MKTEETWPDLHMKAGWPAPGAQKSLICKNLESPGRSRMSHKMHYV